MFVELNNINETYAAYIKQTVDFSDSQYFINLDKQEKISEIERLLESYSDISDKAIGKIMFLMNSLPTKELFEPLGSGKSIGQLINENVETSVFQNFILKDETKEVNIHSLEMIVNFINTKIAKEKLEEYSNLSEEELIKKVFDERDEYVEVPFAFPETLLEKAIDVNNAVASNGKPNPNQPVKKSFSYDLEWTSNGKIKLTYADTTYNFLGTNEKTIELDPCQTVRIKVERDMKAFKDNKTYELKKGNYIDVPAYYLQYLYEVYNSKDNEIIIDTVDTLVTLATLNPIKGSASGISKILNVAENGRDIIDLVVGQTHDKIVETETGKVALNVWSNISAISNFMSMGRSFKQTDTPSSHKIIKTTDPDEFHGINYEQNSTFKKVADKVKAIQKKYLDFSKMINKFLDIGSFEKLKEKVTLSMSLYGDNPICKKVISKLYQISVFFGNKSEKLKQEKELFELVQSDKQAKEFFDYMINGSSGSEFKVIDDLLSDPEYSLIHKRLEKIKESNPARTNIHEDYLEDIVKEERQKFYEKLNEYKDTSIAEETFDYNGDTYKITRKEIDVTKPSDDKKKIIKVKIIRNLNGNNRTFLSEDDIKDVIEDVQSLSDDNLLDGFNYFI